LAKSLRIRFELERPDTWEQLPEGNIIWCFPAEPVDLVRRFSAATSLASRRLVVLGSTSAYDTTASNGYPPPWIDETAPLDLRKARVQGEEFLWSECGATVLRVAGIYGPGRNPIQWLRSGRVAPSRKYVNLIHVEDLASICLAALDLGKPGHVYNVSDGTPRTWDEIATRTGAVPSQPVPRDSAQESGKRILTRKLTSELRVALRYPDLYLALQEIAANDRLP
jgi:nucleoside-diphosphate-sugar epimerase